MSRAAWAAAGATVLLVVETGCGESADQRLESGTLTATHARP